jgi:gamma-glutamyltranspeptidase/glutathione hydrolase
MMTSARSILRTAVVIAALVGACGTPTPLQRDPRWPEPKLGAVSTEHPRATAAALAVLDQGGNAADAAVTAALVLAVVHPQAGNLGGGGFAVFVPHTGEARAFDFRETAPRAASLDKFLGPDGAVVPERSREGPLSVCVPGTPAGLYELFRTCGSNRFTLADLARPAIELAQSGFEIDAWLAHDLAQPNVRERFNAPARTLFYPGGVALVEGETLRQPELAQTLSVFANSGPSGFYNGHVAEALIAELGASAASGAHWIDAVDLKSYRVIPRAPLRGWFRGFEVLTVPPPSSGGVLLLQVLGMLEGLPLDAERTKALTAYDIERQKGAPTPTDDPGLSERMVHWWIEALRRAFADRAAHLGDPDFVDVPVAKLLSPEWIAERRISISESADPGVSAWSPTREGTQTTHVSVLDARGNAVSMTTTLNSTFGSGILVRGAGFLLNNELDDFALAPSIPNQFGLVGSSANALAPGKRPLSSMTPVVMRAGGHATTLVIGSPGGPRIISAIAQVLLRSLVLEEPIDAAIQAPRLHQQWNPPNTRFEAGWDANLLAALQNRRGHSIEIDSETFGCVQAVWLADPGAEPVAISDPRGGGAGGVQGKEQSTPAKPPKKPTAP